MDQTGQEDTAMMRGTGRHPVATRLAALILGGVFVAAAVPKILHPAEFALAVFRYHLLPSPLINLLAIYLPWLELVSGLTMIFLPRWRRAAALVIMLMLVVFTTAVSTRLVRGLDIACGCFSVDPHHGRIGLWNVARNLILLGMGLWVYAGHDT